MASAATTFSAATFTVAAFASAATTATLMRIADCLQFVLGCLANILDVADEMEIFSCQRMVEIDGHEEFRDGCNLGVDDLSVCGLERNDCTFINTLGIKLAIAVEEDWLRQFANSLLVVVAVGVGIADGEVEVCACFQSFQLSLKGVEHHSFAVAIYEGMLQRSLLPYFFGIAGVLSGYIQFVAETNY